MEPSSGDAAMVTTESHAGRENRLRELLGPTVEALGFELWGVEHLAQGRHSVLRVYIERPEGISVDDCAAVSEQVSAVLDVEDPINGEYTLEVSSPGLDRRLFALAQYGRYLGETIDLRLRSPFEGRRKFRGLLKGVEQEPAPWCETQEADQHER